MTMINLQLKFTGTETYAGRLECYDLLQQSYPLDVDVLTSAFE